MNCQQVQTNLSLYLYGELQFGEEDALENHLSRCAFCQHALAREKQWHSALNAERQDVPLDLLSQCRRDLKVSVAVAKPKRNLFRSWLGRIESFGFSSTRWSSRLALASFLVSIGFLSARWIDQSGLPSGITANGTNVMSVLGPTTARIRDIQPANNGVRIILDQVQQQEVTGRVNDDAVRRLLLQAAQDPEDPAIRVDSVEMLKNDPGTDVRDALLHSVEHDPNAAVRMKALEGLRQFANDPETRAGLQWVLEHDENPGVRSEAIDVLAPANQRFTFNPQFADSLQAIAQAQPDDDYVRDRCFQILRAMNASLDIY